jgi:hypothetical protein
MDSLYESSKKLLYYLTHLYGYNNFIVDEVDDELVRALRDAIVSEDRVKAVQIYLRIDKELDEIRNKHCYNNSELPYRSNFRSIAKDVYRELKKKHLTNHDDVKHIAYILRFISTSDYYQIREMLVKRSLSFHMYGEIPVPNDNFPNNVYPIEFILDYCVKMVSLFIKWRD